MPQYQYTAVDQATGRERRGLIEGLSTEAVVQTLKSRGLAPLQVALSGADAPLARQADGRKAKTAGRPRSWTSFGRVLSLKALAVFTRQLATLVKAGLPLLRSLEVLARQERNRRFRPVVEDLAAGIKSGGTLSDGLQRHPKVFDRLYIDMVRAGEAGGVLEAVLLRLAEFQEKSVKTRGRIKSAMIYPLIIIVVAAGIVAALMVFVVPNFQAIFADTLKGAPLPMLTQVVIGASNLLKHHILLVLAACVLCAWAIRLAARSPRGRWVLHSWQLHLPVVGDLYLKSAVARFSRTFGTLLDGGVPILEALRITADTSGNVRVSRAIMTVHDRVKSGDDVAGPLRATGVFPDMVASMVEVGEETGALGGMLIRVADSYDEEVDNAVNALTSLIEPVMIVVMAFMVGAIVIALFLPIVRIIQSLG